VKRATCPACGGTRWQIVEGRRVPCQACRGTGRVYVAVTTAEQALVRRRRPPRR
jgi:hypothetical protein